MSLIFFIQGKAIHGLGSTGLVSSGALLLMDLGTSEFYRLWKAEVGTYGGTDEPSVRVGLQAHLGPSSYRAGALYGGLEES